MQDRRKRVCTGRWESEENSLCVVADVSVGLNAASSQDTSELETPCGGSRDENGEDKLLEEGVGEQLTLDVDSVTEGNTDQVRQPTLLLCLSYVSFLICVPVI